MDETTSLGEARRLLAVGAGIAVMGLAVAAASPAGAATIHYKRTATIAVGPGPAGVAVDPALHHLYVGDYHDNSLRVVDTQTSAVIATIPMSGTAALVAVDPSNAQVLVAGYDSQSGVVEVMDGRTDAITSTVRAGSGFGHIVVDPTTHTAYLGERDDGTSYLDAIDDTSGTLSGQTPLGGQIVVAAVDPSLHQIYVSDDDKLVVVDSRTLQVTATVALPAGQDLDQGVVDPATHVVYLCSGSGSSGSIVPFDGQTLEFQSAITVGGRQPLAVDVSGGTVFVALDTANIAQVDTSSAKVRNVRAGEGKTVDVVVDTGVVYVSTKNGVAVLTPQ